jgi:hypothetical protein
MKPCGGRECKSVWERRRHLIEVEFCCYPATSLVVKLHDMSLRNIIIAGLCISGLVANALESVVPTLDAAAKYQASLIAAKHIVVFEGLPHQSWDRELLATESKREDTRMIWEYRFYTPSVVATNAKELRQVLSYPGSIVVYGGPRHVEDTIQTTVFLGRLGSQFTALLFAWGATRSCCTMARRL